MEFIFTTNNGSTSFQVDPSAGLESLRWRQDDAFWAEFNEGQMGHLAIMTSYLRGLEKDHNKWLSIVDRMVCEQTNFGALSSQALSDFKERLITDALRGEPASQEQFNTATVAICNWAVKFLGQLKDQCIEQGAQQDSQFIQEIDTAIWGAGKTAEMFTAAA